MRTIDDYLAEHPFFSGLGPDALATVAACATNVHVQTGDVLLRTGDPADAFYAIRHGRVAIELRTPAGGPVVLDSVHDGEIVGWSWLVPPHRWQFGAVAEVETCAWELDTDRLRALAERDPVFGYALALRVAGTLLDRLQATRARLLDLYGSAGV
jgi:CRP-like cAMP-binding protein